MSHPGKTMSQHMPTRPNLFKDFELSGQLSKPASMRQVVEEREIQVVTRPSGCIQIFGNKDAYKLAHAGRDPQDDNVKQESFVLPDGKVSSGFKACF